MHWKTKIYQSAHTVAKSFEDDKRVVGVAFGGSVAKNMVWKHSDLELCIVVNERIEDYEYFNFIEGMGVEIIQIEKSKIQEFIEGFTQPDEKVLSFPIQIYKCKILYDPQNILSEFKKIYDNSLFNPNVANIRETQHIKNTDDEYEKAKASFAKEHYKTALSHLRLSVNELLLVYYWHYGILPRSQNRTVHFLKKNSKAFGNDVLYNAFVDIFCLNKSLGFMRNALNTAKDEIFEISENWGQGTPEFLQKAVDINLEWGYPKSITYVYKWCMHLLTLSLNEEGFCDTKDFNSKYPKLNVFLDFMEVSKSDLEEMFEKYDLAKKSM